MILAAIALSSALTLPPQRCYDVYGYPTQCPPTTGIPTTEQRCQAATQAFNAQAMACQAKYPPVVHYRVDEAAPMRRRCIAQAQHQLRRACPY